MSDKDKGGHWEPSKNPKSPQPVFVPDEVEEDDEEHGGHFEPSKNPKNPVPDFVPDELQDFRDAQKTVYRFAI